MQKNKLRKFIIYSVAFHLVLISAILIYFYKHPISGGKTGTVMVGIVSGGDVSQKSTGDSSKISESSQEKKEIHSPDLALKKDDLKEEITTQKKTEKIKKEEPAEIAKQKPVDRPQPQRSSDTQNKSDDTSIGQETASAKTGESETQGNTEASGSAGYNTELAYPDYNHNPKPKYPKVARKRGYEGEVKLKVFVLANGRVGKIEIIRPSGHEILDRSALEAVKDWVFVPGRENGKEISSWVTVPIAFQLKNG